MLAYIHLFLCALLLDIVSFKKNNYSIKDNG